MQRGKPLNDIPKRKSTTWADVVLFLLSVQVEHPWDLAHDSGQQSWHIPIRIIAHPRGAFISVGDPPPTENHLLLLTTWRGGSLLDWDKINRIRSAKCFFKNAYRKKVTIIYRRNKNEKKQKMCATLENTWFWIVREKIQKNKKKTCIIAADWIY